VDENVCCKVLNLILKQLGQGLLIAARELLIVNILSGAEFLKDRVRDKVRDVPLLQSIEMAILRRMKGGLWIGPDDPVDRIFVLIIQLLEKGEKEFTSGIYNTNILSKDLEAIKWENADDLDQLEYDCRSLSYIIYQLADQIKSRNLKNSELTDIHAMGVKLLIIANTAISCRSQELSVSYKKTEGFMKRVIKKEQRILIIAELLRSHGNQKNAPFYNEAANRTGLSRTRINELANEAEMNLSELSDAQIQKQANKAELIIKGLEELK